MTAAQRQRRIALATLRTQRRRKLHPEKYRRYARAAYLRHRAANLARVKRWKKAHPARMRAINRRSLLKSIRYLSDSYIRSTLCAYAHQSIARELIAIKRIQIKIYRLLRKSKTT